MGGFYVSDSAYNMDNHFLSSNCGGGYSVQVSAPFNKPHAQGMPVYWYSI